MKDCGMGPERKGEIKILRVSNGVKKGFALITVLAILIVIVLGTATVLQSVGSQTNMKSNNLSEVKYQYLAEAAIQRALWQCRQAGGCAAIPGSYDIEGTSVTMTKTLTGGTYTIKAVPADYTNV